MRAAAAWLLLALAGCASDEPADQGPTAEQLRNIAEVNAAAEAPPPEQLFALTQAEIDALGLAGPRCGFRTENGIVLATSGAIGIARTQAGFDRLSASAEIGPTGGFLENPRTSISVGGASGATPARLTYVNRAPHGGLITLDGLWTCGG